MENLPNVLRWFSCRVSALYICKELDFCLFINWKWFPINSLHICVFNNRVAAVVRSTISWFSLQNTNGFSDGYNIYKILESIAHWQIVRSVWRRHWALYAVLFASCATTQILAEKLLYKSLSKSERVSCNLIDTIECSDEERLREQRKVNRLESSHIESVMKDNESQYINCSVRSLCFIFEKSRRAAVLRAIWILDQSRATNKCKTARTKNQTKLSSSWHLTPFFH